MEIDYVVPMVFDDDAHWRASYLSAVGVMSDDVRFRSWGAEASLVELVKRNLPFVRYIYILLSSESQQRCWMEESKIRVVYHRDFIPVQYLPCFNASLIEMFLHRIPGLSEYFIYGNDDVFPLSPLRATDFFVDGVPCLHFEEVNLAFILTHFEYMCRRELNLVGRMFGHQYTGTYLDVGHSLSPLLKSSCSKVFQEFETEIMSSLSPLGRRDFNINQYIYLYWQYFTGAYIDCVPKRVVCDLNTPSEIVEKLIMSSDAGIVCVNDIESENDYHTYSAMLRRLLSSKLSNPPI